MGKINWTDEQLAAINIRGADTLVSAAAGSGKTAVLVERVIQMITDAENPVDVDRLLVVTFTNAAAQQMKEKISASLTKAINSDPYNLRLRNQLMLLGNAEINTVHSFCMNVIRENFQKTDLPYDFDIVHETERRMLMEDALDETFSELYDDEERSADFERFVDSFSGRDDTSAAEICLKMYEFLRSMPFYKNWVEKNINRLTFENPSDTVWGKVMLSYGESMVRCAENINSWLLSYIEENGETLGIDVYKNGCLADRDVICGMNEALKQGIGKAYAYLEDLKFLPIGRKRAETDPESGEFVKAVREQVKGIFKKLKEDIFYQSEEEINQIAQLCIPSLSVFADIVFTFDRKYSDKKQKKGVVDFSDLEHKCAEILADFEDGECVPSEVALALRERYSEVLVDEYQDTNNLQELIMSLVSGKGKRFMVGDVKQSIYGFRNSKPELFLEKYENYSRADGGDDRRLLLSKNFRSSDNVLSFVNFVFSALMCKSCGGLDYKEDEKLYSGGGYSFADSTDLYIFDTDEFDDEYEKAEREALLCASLIKSKVDSKAEVESGGVMRPCAFGDFTILLRNISRYTDIYRNAFMQYGIPLFVDSGSSYFESQGVKLTVALLRVIDNPRQDIDLIAVLRSHIFGFDDDMLVSVRLEDKTADFYTCLKKASENGLLPAVRFFDSLKRWRRIAGTCSVRVLTEVLFDECNMYTVYPECADKFRALADWAEKFGKTSYKGLFRFITFLKRQIEENDDIGGNSVVSNDCVTLMSIHKSKGLENSIVILGNTGSEFNLTDANARIIFDDELGIAADYADTENKILYATMPKIAAKIKTVSDCVSEELRLLYVALTRAKCKLIIMGSIKNFEGHILKLKSMAVAKNEDGFSVYSSLKLRCYLDWILTALLFHPKCSLLHTCGPDITEKRQADFDVNIVLNPSFESFGERVEKKISETAADDNYDNIRQILEYSYPDIVSTTIPSKLSVSEIKNKFYAEFTDDETVFYPRSAESTVSLTPAPAFLSDSGKLSASEAGVAYHSVLQYIDFSSSEKLSVLLDGLREKGVLTSAERNAIDEKVISVFLKSSLCRDIIRAEQVFKEYSFIIPFDSSKLFGGNSETIMVQGIIDCVYRLDGEYYIVDYKSDYYSSASEIADRYRVQLSVYADAVEKKIGKRPVKCMLYMLRTGEIILF